MSGFAFWEDQTEVPQLREEVGLRHPRSGACSIPRKPGAMTGIIPGRRNGALLLPPLGQPVPNRFLACRDSGPDCLREVSHEQVP